MLLVQYVLRKLSNQKTITMKIKNLFYLLLALPLAFAACEETPNEVEKPVEKSPVLTLTSDAVLNFDAEGGEAEITYTLENAVEGTELTATCEADWVEAVAGDKVRVTVAANEGDARETKIVVAYGDKNFEVAVKQAAKAEAPAKEYLYDEVLAFGERISLADYGFPNNYYLIGFYNESGEILLGVVIVGADGEDILQAGTYTAANGGLMMEGFELYVGETEEYFFEGGDGTIVVGGDIDGYTFDIELTDADAQNFHFTFEGEVIGMQLPGNVLPTEPVNFTAENLDGEYYGTEYSPTYNYYVLLSDLGLDEDGYSLPGGTYYQVDLYSVEGTVDADGYIHIPAGTYVFDANDTMAEWTLGNYYSGYFKINADGTAYEGKGLYEAGQAVVTENSLVLTVTINGVQHTVTYNGAPKLYVGTSGGGSGENVEMEANYAYANYFGDQYTPGYADNYYLFLSDLGLDAEGYEQANGTYYRFDIYAPISADNATKVPAGTYTVDMSDSGALWTASLSYSAYFVLDEYGWDYAANDYPASGTIVVGEDGTIVAEVTMLMSGATHKVTYNGGNIVVYDNSSSEGGEGGDDVYSTLTGDWNCNLSAHTLYYEGYGDWYEVGYQNWVIAIMPNSQEGDFVQFDLLASTSDTSFAGEYTISDSLEAYTAYPGYIDASYLAGSWYYKEDGVTMAPFVDGWVNVVDNGDGTYTVEFDVWDDCDYNLTGSWTGEIHPASELQSVTRSSSMKQFKSIVVNEAAPVAKERIVAKNVKKASAAAPAKGLKLR